MTWTFSDLLRTWTHGRTGFQVRATALRRDSVALPAVTKIHKGDPLRWIRRAVGQHVGAGSRNHARCDCHAGRTTTISFGSSPPWNPWLCAGVRGARRTAVARRCAGGCGMLVFGCDAQVQAVSPLLVANTTH